MAPFDIPKTNTLDSWMSTVRLTSATTCLTKPTSSTPCREAVPQHAPAFQKPFSPSWKAATKPPRSAAASPTEAFLGLVSAAKFTVQHHDQRGRNPQTGRPVQVVAAVTDPMDVRSGGRALALRDAHPLHPGVSGVGAAHCLTAGSRAELAFLGQQAGCPDAWFGGGIGMPGHTENGSACDEDRQDEGAHFHGLDGSSSAW